MVAKEPGPRLTGRMERLTQQMHRLWPSIPVPRGEGLFEEDGHLDAESHQSSATRTLLLLHTPFSDVYFPVMQHIKPSKTFPPKDLMDSGEL